MEDKIENDKLVEKSYQVVEIDKRLFNIEKTIESLESIAVEGITKWSDNKKQQIELEKEKQKINDTQHKRATKIIVIVITVVFILSLMALIYQQYDLVKWILSSSFAVGAGAGISNMLKKK